MAPCVGAGLGTRPQGHPHASQLPALSNSLPIWSRCDPECLAHEAGAPAARCPSPNRLGLPTGVLWMPVLDSEFFLCPPTPPRGQLLEFSGSQPMAPD